MKDKIDILIINNCPSFYKINLYNELAKKCKIHVVFIGLTNQVVINDDFENDIHFQFDLLSKIQIEKRIKILSLLKLSKIIRAYNFNKIVYGGYDDFEEKLFMFLTPKRKNCLQFESSIRESKVTGFVSKIKKLFFSRISIAMPSGNMQSAVFKALNFKGQVVESKGVGIFNKSLIARTDNNTDTKLRYLFIGRLIPIKNLEFLIRVFNQLQKPLTIVGTGVLEEHLKSISNSNITFTGFVNNNVIHELYYSHDVFVLPSISETWGLVVEEAVYYGLPVLVSDAVGCQTEMVLKPNTGIVFSPVNENDLLHAIEKLDNNFDTYKQNCLNFNFEKRDSEQINAYLKILSL
jgi:glycosyltransferase involved in cell wall biosynthesis